MKVLMQMKYPFQIDIADPQGDAFTFLVGECTIEEKTLVFETALLPRHVAHDALQEMIGLPDSVDLQALVEAHPHIGRIN